jgi:ATP-dependent Clp protease ATP-binding subunit ClpA
LDAAALEKVLEMQVTSLQEHLDRRLGERSFTIEVPRRSRLFLLKHGTSVEYGARELKRTVHRFVMQPLAALVAEGRVPADSVMRFEVSSNGKRLELLPGRLAA